MKKNISKQMHHILDTKNVKGIMKELCGELLGQGLYRDVYVLKLDDEYVVKIERDMSTGVFANATEWRNYEINKWWDFLAPWLAPCEAITETSQILIQRRVEHRRRKDYPKYIPAMFTDLKLKNFGWIGDQFVCCDYSFIPFYVVKVGKNMMKYAKWWGSLKK